MEIAEMVGHVVGQTTIVTEPSPDNRSYHISSEKIRRELGFEPMRSIELAAKDLVRAFGAGRIPNPMDDDRYYNIRTMQAAKLR
jgi:nucleoside-diphosphate-sugar epimerase